MISPDVTGLGSCELRSRCDTCHSRGMLELTSLCLLSELIRAASGNALLVHS